MPGAGLPPSPPWLPRPMAANSKMAAASPATNFALRKVGSSSAASALATPWKASLERCSTGMTLMPDVAGAAGPAPSGLGLGGAASGSRRLNRPSPPPPGTPAVVAVGVGVADLSPSSLPPPSDEARGVTLEWSAFDVEAGKRAARGMARDGGEVVLFSPVVVRERG